MKPIDEMSYDELLDLRTKVENRFQIVSRQKEAQDRIDRRNRNEQRAIRERQLEAESEEIFDNLHVGDIVKITGTRNPRYPFREVTSLDHNRRQFTGWQMGYRNWRKPEGGLIRGSEHTTHMSNKIRGIINRE